MMEEDYLCVQEMCKIIRACMTVYRELGAGFLEAVCQEALAIEFVATKIPFQREKTLEIVYKGTPLTKKYVADFTCFDSIILELKAVDDLSGPHAAQVINYLKAN
jgi:GxxExxY protein